MRWWPPAIRKTVYLSPALALGMSKHKLDWSAIAQRAWLAAIEAEERKARDHAELVGMLGPYVPVGRLPSRA